MKYDHLGEFLSRQTATEIPMTFSEIETLIGRPLPPSARRHRPWWSNNETNSAMTKAWRDAGYRTERVDMGGERLIFRKADGEAPTQTKSSTDNPLAGLYGAMRGTVRLLPEVDLTQPIDEAWSAEID